MKKYLVLLVVLCIMAAGSCYAGGMLGTESTSSVFANGIVIGSGSYQAVYSEATDLSFSNATNLGNNNSIQSTTTTLTTGQANGNGTKGSFFSAGFKGTADALAKQFKNRR